jgi:hypothetical protein
MLLVSDSDGFGERAKKWESSVIQTVELGRMSSAGTAPELRLASACWTKVSILDSS